MIVQNTTNPPQVQAKSVKDLMETIAVYHDSDTASEFKIAEQALQDLLERFGELLWHLVHDRLKKTGQTAPGKNQFRRK